MDLGQIIKIRQNEVCGLDIGSSAVKIVALCKSGSDYKITAAGMTQIASEFQHIDSPDKTNQIRTETSITNAIRDCFTLTKLRSRKKFKTRLAVCGVSGPEVAVRDFSFPPLPEEEMRSAVNLEAELVCPFSADQVAVDYQLLSNSDDNSKGIFVAATNTIITNKIQHVKKAGLKCVVVDVDGLALLNCFNNLASDEEKSAAAILNVGNSYTTLAILNKEGWPFIRDTSCAGDYIIRQIVNDENISPEALFSNLFDDLDDEQIELENSLEKASEKLITGVSEALRFYAAQEKSIPVKKIFVCGGFAPARGFVELLNRRLGVQALLWNPFDSSRCQISKKYKEIFKKVGPMMAIATGLAMRSIENSN